MKITGKTEFKFDETNRILWNRRYEDPAKVYTEATALLLKAKKSDYRKGIAHARLNIAASSFLQSKNDIALEQLSEALLWFSENQSDPGYASALNLKGNLYESFGDYEKALQFCLRANTLSSEANDKDTEAETCSQLGLIYTRLCNFIKALEYYNKALHIREEMNDENAVASSLNRIGMIMRLTRRYEESLDYYNRSLAIRQKNNQTTSVPWTLLGLASTYEEIPDPSRALGFYKKGMKGGDIRCTLQCMLGCGRIESANGNSDRAEKMLSDALKIAQELKANSLIAETYAALANHYEMNSDYEKSLYNHKLWQKTREIIHNDEARNRLRNIEISHAIEKSEQEKEIFRLRHIELKGAYDIIEEKNKDITASINYASRIQHAMLPVIDEIENFDNKCFILYLPKDIVSGDFYWFNRINDKLFVVAADCTGHGVPGAMMSMLGISLLEEVINYQEITESGLILDELRRKVLKSLHQNGKSQETKDGMDISLCIIDQSTKNIEFSGAYNSLYLIRKKELIEFRADRMPIGVSGFEEKSFTTQLIPYLPGDIIYLFSDGYADQFGGEFNKKYKYSTLKEQLLKIHKLPLQEQKEKLQKEFRDWKGTSPQIDDVLLIGMKLV